RYARSRRRGRRGRATQRACAWPHTGSPCGVWPRRRRRGACIRDCAQDRNAARGFPIARRFLSAAAKRPRRWGFGDELMARVVVYTAAGCSLCERALEVVHAAQRELGFELELVAIDGDPALEAEYRELI